MNRNPDAEVILSLIPTESGGKTRSILSGYRPVYCVKPDYWTSTHHELIGVTELLPGQQCNANVWFVSPEYYPHALWVGQELNVAEGSKKVGTAIITNVFNVLLQK